MPVARISTSTSPAFGPSRSTVSITSGSPALYPTAARVFIVVPQAYWVAGRQDYRTGPERRIRPAPGSPVGRIGAAAGARCNPPALRRIEAVCAGLIVGGAHASFPVDFHGR